MFSLTLPKSQLATERQVMNMETHTVVILVVGIVTAMVAVLTLVIKLIELGRK
jgi:uncharacterized protein HemY